MSMMATELNSWMLFGHAARHFGDTEVVTQLDGGKRHRYTYAQFSARSQQLMHALDHLGLDHRAPVATLGWNSYRHLECYFGIPCSGRILHTLNPRLPLGDLEFIIQDAGDQVILVEPELLPLLERIPAALARVQHLIALADRTPDSALPQHLVAYEDLIAGEPTSYPAPSIPESSDLGICYTSGTSGRPKGVVYTHRSTVLHALVTTSGAGTGLGPGDCTLPIVPMYHVNAWGAPFGATMIGAKQVFTSRHVDAATIVDLIQEEQVTHSSGVPTIWIAVADELSRRGARLPSVRFLSSGGSRTPRSLIERYRAEFGINLVQGWGMTETSPVASLTQPKHKMRDWDESRLMGEVREQAGLPLPGIDIRIVDPAGEEVPADGESMGELMVRGPWVAASYLGGQAREQFTADGWFRTGDVAVATAEGYFAVVDRIKDLVKSGGEWISSADMESRLMGMEGVAEAAIIAVPDPKWGERPLAVIAPRAGAEIRLEDVRRFLAEAGWASWQLPDRLEIVADLPKTSVGKFDKKVLRQRFASAAPLAGPD
ncbi:MAG: long-chain-fatty-acid--CoA ligase [Candidatus Dormibacteria bacterium]